MEDFWIQETAHIEINKLMIKIFFDELDKEGKEEHIGHDDFSKSFHDIFGEHYPEFKNQSDNSNPDINIDLNVKNYKNIIDINELKAKINNYDYIDYAIKIVQRTVKCEIIFIKQILFTALHSYIQNDPINLAIMAPTSEGKAYAVEECIKIFQNKMFLK